MNHVLLFDVAFPGKNDGGNGEDESIDEGDKQRVRGINVYLGRDANGEGLLK